MIIIINDNEITNIIALV